MVLGTFDCIILGYYHPSDREAPELTSYRHRDGFGLWSADERAVKVDEKLELKQASRDLCI